MDKQQFAAFLKEASDQGATGHEVAEIIKEATGEQVDPQQLQALMAQMGGGGGQPGGDPSQQGGGAPSGGLADPSMQDPMAGASGADPSQGGGHPGADPSGGMGGMGMGGGQPGGEMPLSEEQIHEIAHLIAQQIASQSQHPEHASHHLPPEAQDAMKQGMAEDYIAGLLKRANEYGISLDDSVDIYVNQLNRSVEWLKQAADRNEEVSKVAAMIDEDTLARFQGMAEKAAEDNLSYEDTLELLKAAGFGEELKQQFTNNK